MGRYAFKHEEFKRHIVISIIILFGVTIGGIGSLWISYEREHIFDSFGA